jgi:hypothetical protein
MLLSFFYPSLFRKTHLSAGAFVFFALLAEQVLPPVLLPTAISAHMGRGNALP